MVKLVVYLAGADYKVRKEKEFNDDEIDTKKKRKKVENELIQKLIKDYGMNWKKARKRQVTVSRMTTVKKVEFKQRIKLKGKDYGVKTIQQKSRTYKRWSKRQEQQVLLLFRQGKGYHQIHRITKRTYESVRSKILRLLGLKKKR